MTLVPTRVWGICGASRWIPPPQMPRRGTTIGGIRIREGAASRSGHRDCVPGHHHLGGRAWATPDGPVTTGGRSDCASLDRAMWNEAGIDFYEARRSSELAGRQQQRKRMD